jgi:23S rRNA (guanine745-N1)-methyltransferase
MPIDRRRKADAAPWRCPVCRARLLPTEGGHRWACSDRHSFDVAREGYVNLLLAGQRRSRQPGDSGEMVAARKRFLATGAFDPISEAVDELVAREDPTVVLDVGCGEGRHTRVVRAPLVLGVDVSKAAVAAAAKADPDSWYAVASAADLPLGDGAVDVVISIFGPVTAVEMARVLRRGGTVVAVHPGTDHLADLRALVYAEVHPHDVKSPLRGASEWFVESGSVAVRFSVEVSSAEILRALFAMTPYRWHAPPDIDGRLEEAARDGFETVADVRLTTYRRTGRPVEAVAQASAR